MDFRDPPRFFRNYLLWGPGFFPKKAISRSVNRGFKRGIWEEKGVRVDSDMSVKAHQTPTKGRGKAKSGKAMGNLEIKNLYNFAFRGWNQQVFFYGGIRGPPPEGI